MNATAKRIENKLKRTINVLQRMDMFALTDDG